MMLVTYHFLFTAEVVTPLELDDHSGSALRGNLFESVWQRFCLNQASQSCAECPLHATCPVSALVAPLREENPRGRDIPRPYITLPPLGTARRYQVGERLLFGLTLFGNIIQLLPYVIMAVPVFEACGLGRKIQENAGKRGTFHIKQIESYNPMTGERQSIYQRGKPLVNAPALAITAADVAARAARLSTEQITLNLLTPLRLIDKERQVRQPSFRVLVQRLLERLTNLEMAYSTGPERPVEEKVDLVRLAFDIECVKDDTYWEDVQSYSRRQRAFSPIGGLMGQMTFAGDLAPFRDLLVWGELIHVGKSAVKGNGWYQLIC